MKLPPGQGWSPAGSESCVVWRRLPLRSVDSECVGRVIEPRKKPCARVDDFASSEGNIEPPQGPGVSTSPGSKSRACTHWDSPGTWEALVISTQKIRPRTGGQNPKTPCRQGASTDPAIDTGRGVVPLTEGNEVKRDGSESAERATDTDEGGEPEPRGPAGGKGEPSLRNRGKERWTRHGARWTSHRDCNG